MCKPTVHTDLSEAEKTRWLAARSNPCDRPYVSLPHCLRRRHLRNAPRAVFFFLREADVAACWNQFRIFPTSICRRLGRHPRYASATGGSACEISLTRLSARQASSRASCLNGVALVLCASWIARRALIRKVTTPLTASPAVSRCHAHPVAVTSSAGGGVQERTLSASRRAASVTLAARSTRWGSKTPFLDFVGTVFFSYRVYNFDNGSTFGETNPSIRRTGSDGSTRASHGAVCSCGPAGRGIADIGWYLGLCRLFFPGLKIARTSNGVRTNMRSVWGNEAVEATLRG